MTKNVQSHNYSKGIIKSFLVWLLESKGTYEIVKINELGGNSIYRITNQEDIKNFLKIDNNFYFNVKGRFEKKIKVPFKDYYLITEKQILTPDNSSIKRIKEIENYWNVEFESPYFELMKKIYNSMNYMNQKFIKETEKQISEMVTKERNKKIILNFVGLNLLRNQFLRGRNLARKIEVSGAKKLSKPFWEYNASEKIYDNLDFLTNELTFETTNIFVSSVFEKFKDYGIKIIEVEFILSKSFVNPCFIHLFSDDVLILPIAFKNLAIVVIKKNHLIKYDKVDKFSLIKLKSNEVNSAFQLFSINISDLNEKKEVLLNCERDWFSFLINTWIYNYGVIDGTIYAINDGSVENFYIEFEKTKNYFLKTRHEYYENKLKEVDPSMADLVLVGKI